MRSTPKGPSAYPGMHPPRLTSRSYVYYTQIMQAETLASAYRLWRRNWKGKGREYTAGALVWQINDCWPVSMTTRPSRKDDTDCPPAQVTSWAIVDYFQRPKPAYYAIARELRPYTVGMTRKEHTTYASDTTAASFEIATVLEVWGTNAALLEKKIVLEVAAFELGSEWKESWTKDAVLAPNAATELFSGPLPGQPVRTKLSDVPRTIVMSARLIDADGTVLARYSNWCARTSLSAPCVLLTAAGQAGAVQVHPLPVQGSARAAHRARRGRRVRRAQREAARQGRRA
jgi:beta-mannosidase